MNNTSRKGKPSQSVKTRKKTAVWISIHLFIALQMTVPLHYYVARSDKNDERFAWRMFSPVRMLRCAPSFSVGEPGTPVGNLSSIFHEAWIRLAQRGRLGVVTAMAKELCERNPEEPVRVKLTCTTVSGETKNLGGGWNVCQIGSM
jgi:hypothetical protein